MGTWILLSLLSAVALYMAFSLHRPMLIAATAVATGLGILMVILRFLLSQRINREIRRR